MKRMIFLTALLLSAVVVSANEPTSPKREKTSEVKIMSYNIRYINAPGDEGDLAWDARKGPSLTMILQEQPDVIGYQEPKLPQVEFLAEQLPQYGHVEAGRDAGVKEDGGEHLMVMWLKDKYDLLDWGFFWLSDTPEVVSRGWDGECRRVTVWVKLKDKDTKKEFFYFDTHLDHKGDEARREGAKLNVEKMKEIAGEDAVLFISGDMNSSPSKEYLIEAYKEWMLSCRLTSPVTNDRPTFNGFGKSAAMLLDHIFYRNAVPLKYETFDGENYGVKYISDHYPIMGTFSF